MSTFTINYVRKCLRAYISRLKEIEQEDKENCIRHTAQAKQDLLDSIQLLCKLYPDLFQMNLPEFLGEADLEQLKNRLRHNAEHRYSIDYLATPVSLSNIVNGQFFETAAIVPWHDENNATHNFVINYNDAQRQDAADALQILVMNMMLALPAGKVLLNVFDFEMSGIANAITSGLAPELYHDEIIYSHELAAARIKGLLEHMADVMKNYNNLAAYNNRNRKIALPYEIVILNGYPKAYDNFTDELMPLFKNGHMGGIYFIILNNTAWSLRNKEEKHLLDVHNYYAFKTPDSNNTNNSDNSSEYLVRYTPWHKRPLLCKNLYDYLNEEIRRQPQRTVLKQDFGAISSTGYQSTSSEISVTIGMDIDRNEPVTVRFNSGDFIHAFILGQSGSGKSVLLNNIITSAINKYAPEDLMLYLLDFKGVEFNRYRGIKHAKAILVDNSDPQMTLEILRELKDENRKRIKLWQSEGVNNIDGYNRKHPEQRIPQVLFIADECQVMFSKPDGRPSSYAIQREIADILNIIATQGRSQGIHMLLATQTLDETDISGQILKNLTECFLLMCAPSDSNLLVPDSSDLTSKQPTGECCYYHKKELVGHVQTFYAKDKELENAISASIEKSSNSSSNGGAYFRGSSMFELNAQEQAAIAKLTDKCPVAAVGHKIGLSNELTAIKLQKDFSENILFFGVNREEQTVGVMINALMSLVISYQQLQKHCDFIVIDCLNNEEGRYRSMLNAMESNGLCQLVTRNDSGRILQRLVQDIGHHCAEPTIIAIIGSERFAEMKRKSPLSGNDDGVFDPANDVISMDMGALGNLMGDGANFDTSRIKTFPEALKFILDEGPMQGVHVLLQVDKPENILFEGEFCTEATDKFHHKVILKTENKYLTPMRFSEDIDVETLSADEERLRAYYYPDNGSPQLFTPYLMPKSQKIINTLTITTTIKWEQQIVQ